MVCPKGSNKSSNHFARVVNRQSDLGNVSNCCGAHTLSVDKLQRSWFFKLKQRKVRPRGASLVEECVSSRPRVYENMGFTLVRVVNDCTL